MNSIQLDDDFIHRAITEAVEEKIISAIDQLKDDPEWIKKIEHMVNQSMVQRIVAGLSQTDISAVIHQRVDENMSGVKTELLANFSSTGIDDRASQCQLTVLDESTVFENQVVAPSVEVIGSLIVNELVVKSSVNTDNHSWVALSRDISQKTLEQIDQVWRQKLVDQVTNDISEKGITFDQVRIGEEYLVNGNQLSSHITETDIEKVGTLKKLTVAGNTTLNETLAVSRRRVGINTENPEQALTIWDEEVAIGVGKHKQQEAYIGTIRNHPVNLGINKIPQVTLGIDGITAIKQLRVAQHRIGHSTEVPNWSGTRGDIMFNSNPTPGSAFAWVCLGAFKWKMLKVEE
jgi:hypothetical protein